jgi:hypothetical protein
MPFEPSFPGPLQNLFHGHIQAEITDPHGSPPSTIISLTDDFHINVTWQVHGQLVPCICGKWQVRVYVESIGPGPELIIGTRDVAMTGDINYAETIIIVPGTAFPPTNEALVAGVYKVVVIVTSTNLKGQPSPFAGYVELPLIHLFKGANV